MSRIRKNPRPPIPDWLPAAVLGCLLAGTGQAAGAGAPPLDWQGVDTVQGAPSSVRLRFDDDTLRTAELAFGAQRQCRVWLRRTTGTPPGGGFSIVDSGGGAFCDGLYPGHLELLQEPANAGLRIRLAGTPSWSPFLRPVTEASVDPTVIGRWAGHTRPASATPVPVRLEVVSTVPGDRGSRLRFDGGRDCGLPMRYEGAIDGVHGFTLLPADAGGGFCDLIVGGHVQVSAGDGRLRYRLVPGDPDCPQSCTLERVDP